MNEETMNNADAGRIPPPTNAVSLYGQTDAMDDFPVLKAFQQYIDAEQAKAQKRMTTLCIFFAIIMTIIVGVFVALLVNMAQDKNRISDQMIQFMLKERDRSPVVVQPPAGQADATVKALTESMTNLQRQLADQQMKMVEQQTKLFEQRAQAAEQAAAAAARRASTDAEAELNRQPPSPAQVDLAKKNQLDLAKIKKANALLQKQREELAREKERLRQKEIDLQRRKLYPELYETSGKTGVNHFGADDAADDLAELEDLDADDEDLDRAPEPTVRPVATPAPAERAAPPARTAPKQNADGSLSYFDDDEVTVPADSGEPTAGWHLPLD